MRVLYHEKYVLYVLSVGKVMPPSGGNKASRLVIVWRLWGWFLFFSGMLMHKRVWRQWVRTPIVLFQTRPVLNVA